MRMGAKMSGVCALHKYPLVIERSGEKVKKKTDKGTTISVVLWKVSPCVMCRTEAIQKSLGELKPPVAPKRSFFKNLKIRIWRE